MNITYEPDQIPEAVHKISFTDEPTLSKAAMGTSWDSRPDPLADISAMAETIRQSSGMEIDTLHCGLGMYVYLVLGRFVVEIQCGLDWAYSYRLPKSTLSDHLKDCFGWITC